MVDVRKNLDKFFSRTKQKGDNQVIARESGFNENDIAVMVTLYVNVRTTANWSYDFRLESKETAGAANEIGTWSVNKGNYSVASKDAAIDSMVAAFEGEWERLSGLEREEEEFVVEQTTEQTIVDQHTNCDGETCLYSKTEIFQNGDLVSTMYEVVCTDANGTQISAVMYNDQEEAENAYQDKYDYYTMDSSRNVNKFNVGPYSVVLQVKRDGKTCVETPELYSIREGNSFDVETIDLPATVAEGTLDGTDADDDVLIAYVNRKYNLTYSQYVPITGDNATIGQQWNLWKYDKENVDSALIFDWNAGVDVKEDGSELILTDNDRVGFVQIKGAVGGTSGAVFVKVKEGYAAKFTLRTEDTGYFKKIVPADMTFEEIEEAFGGKDWYQQSIAKAVQFNKEGGGTFTSAPFEEMTLYMTGGDSFIVAVDEGVGTIHAYELNINGVSLESVIDEIAPNANDEWYITLDAVYREEEFSQRPGDYVQPDFVFDGDQNGDDGNGGGGGGDGGTESEPLPAYVWLIGAVVVMLFIARMVRGGNDED